MHLNYELKKLTSSVPCHIYDTLCLTSDFAMVEGSYPHRHLNRRHFSCFFFNLASDKAGGGAGDNFLSIKLSTTKFYFNCYNVIVEFINGTLYY